MDQMPDMELGFYFLLAMAAVVGWAVIEFVLWLFSFVKITLG